MILLFKMSYLKFDFFFKLKLCIFQQDQKSKKLALNNNSHYFLSRIIINHIKINFERWENIRIIIIHIYA